MNLLLIEATDYIDTHQVRITGRRLAHIRDVHQIEVGQSLRAGELNGLIGTAELQSIGEQEAIFNLTLSEQAPKVLPATVILAMPRPKMFKRTLQTMAAMGVKEIYLINAYRVDKSYWSTPLLSEISIHEQLTLGLEQAGDTLLPKVHIRKRFKPFIEDELPTLISGKRALIAHPYGAAPCPEASLDETVIAIGPEGGFIPYEVDLMKAQGMTAIHIGQRILRVETAVPVLLSRLFPIQN